VDILPPASVTGDPHYHEHGETFTHQGVPGDTFLFASCDAVRVDGLYVNTNWDTCVIGIAQITIAADPAHNVASHQIVYDLQHQGQVTVDGKVYHEGSKLPTIGGGYQLTWSNGGVQLVVPVEVGNPSAGSGVYSVSPDSSSDNAAIEIDASGSFAGADGILAYLAQGNNIDKGQSTLENYIDSHYNDNSSNGKRFAAYAIDASRWKGL